MHTVYYDTKSLLKTYAKYIFEDRIIFYKNNNQSMLERFYAELSGVDIFQYVMQGKTYLLFANKNYRSMFLL